MGLNIEVGALAGIDTEFLESELEQINRLLRSLNMPEHNEPRDVELRDFELGSYSMIHYLRRLGAHLELRGILPAPGPGPNSAADRVANDPVLQEYYKRLKGKPGILDRLFRKDQVNKRSFDHLIEHSDCEGFYLPIDFESVIYSPPDFGIAGHVIGSAVRLRDECKRIADALELPLDIGPNTDHFFEFYETQRQSAALCEQYAIESQVCLQVYHAADYSVRSGAMIVFC